MIYGRRKYMTTSKLVGIHRKTPVMEETAAIAIPLDHEGTGKKPYSFSLGYELPSSI